MKKLLIIVVLLFMVSLLVSANLSDDTLELVEDLRWKHSYNLLYSQADCFITGTGIEWSRAFLSIEVEGDRLIVETQDGTWFIKMEKVK